MRSANDFNQFYAQVDPWKISQAGYRDRVLRRLLSPFVDGRSVLELGCGEGHLTRAVFAGARSVLGIDISDVAIDRAKSRNVPNARFEASDFLSIDMGGFETIAAIECIYYLSVTEQEAFWRKAAREHAGKIMVLSAPIIGENQHRRYFTHDGLMALFARHAVHLVEFRNVNVYRQAPGVPRAIANAAAVLARAPLGAHLLDLIPEALIYQRLYVLRMPSR